MASAMIDLWLPSQPQSVTALWPVQNYTCLMTEAHGCEQLAQSCYSVADWPGVELATFRSRANALTTATEPPERVERIVDINVFYSTFTNVFFLILSRFYVF